MPATDLERLVVTLSADLKQYEKGMARAQGVTIKALRGVEKSAKESTSKIETAFAGIGSGIKAKLGLLAAGAAAAIGEIARSAIKSAADIGDLADKIGVSTTYLQELQYGAVQASMSFQDLERGLLKFSRALGEARRGQGELLKLFVANGYSQAAVQAMTYSEALGRVADLIRNAKSEQDKMLITTAAFGERGDDFINFLRDGTAGLRGFKTGIQDAGGAIDDALIRKAQELDSRWAALMESMKRKTQSTVLTIVEILNAAALTGTNSVAAAREKILRQGTRYGANSLPPSAIPKPPPGTTGDRGDFPANINLATGRLFTPTVIPRAPARSQGVSDAERQAAAIARVIDQLKFEGEQLKTNSLQQKINEELRRAGVTASSDEGKQIAALVTANYNLAKSQELSAAATEELARRMQEVKDAEIELAHWGVDAFERIVLGGENALDVMADLAKAIADAALQAALFGEGPLAKLFGSSGGGLFGRLFSGGGSSPVEFYAKGGQIPTGRYGVVGEAGPELLRGPATVTPLGGPVGAGGAVVQIIDQRRNAPPVEQQRGGDGSMRFVIRDEFNRLIVGGAMDAAFGARFALSPAGVRR